MENMAGGKTENLARRDNLEVSISRQAILQGAGCHMAKPPPPGCPTWCLLIITLRYEMSKTNH